MQPPTATNLIDAILFFFVRLVGVKRSFVQSYKENFISPNYLMIFKTEDYPNLLALHYRRLVRLLVQVLTWHFP